MGLLFGEFTLGQRFKTPGRTITTGDIGAFAGLTGDYNPVHTDEVFAAATDFGRCVAHGPMGIGMAFGLAARLDLIDGTVVAGDTIHAMIEVIETRAVKHPDRGLLGLGIALLNQDGTTVQSGTAKLLMRRTPLATAQWGEARPAPD